MARYVIGTEMLFVTGLI